MLSLEDNIRAVLECHFSQCKDELIDSAVDNICHLITVECPIIKERTMKYYCRECFFFNKKYCKLKQFNFEKGDKDNGN